MAIPLMNDDVEIIQKLSDLPNQEDGLSPQQMKERFDAASVLIKAYLNGTLVPAVQQLQKALNNGDIIVLDDTLSTAGQAADAAAVGTALAGKLSEGLYSAEKISVSQNLNTKTFWEQVDEIYNTMPEHTVKFVCAYVTDPYPVGEYPNEPAGGVYRVTITRMAVDYGFVEAAVYLADPLGLPTVITRIKSAGVWRDPVKPVEAILARINAATGVSE